jgi:hypothetical protein
VVHLTGVKHTSIAAPAPVNLAPAFGSPLPESSGSRLRNRLRLREGSRRSDGSGGEDGQEGLELHFDND